MTSEVFAPAKVNLTLHVMGQRADGYHLLDSLVVFADVGDRLWIAPAEQTSISVKGPFADGVPVDAGNLIWAALDKVRETAQVTLEKNLPHGGGVGGGSSDAAAILRYFGVTEGAATLGADVPVCLAASAQRMRGIGDVLAGVEHLPPLFAVLVNPDIHVATPDVFKALKTKENPAMADNFPPFETTDELIQWLAKQRNDLEPAAIATAPEIADVLAQLKCLQQVRLARMSGSGSTCFGLCETKAAANAAAATLAQANPDWWVQACQLS